MTEESRLIIEVRLLKDNVNELYNLLNENNRCVASMEIQERRNEVCIRLVENKIATLENTLCGFMSELDKLKECEKKIRWIESKNKRLPHKCPICDGSRLSNPRSMGAPITNCPSCEGKGIVWG